MFPNDLQATRSHVAHRPVVRRWTIANPLIQRTVLLASTVVAATVVLALVAFSPLALKQLGSLSGLDWTRLSSIGQTYGAASAVLTGLALIGVASSILFQARTIRVSLAESSQEHHARLVQMSMEDPVYMRCWGGDFPSGASHDANRQGFYLNLIMSFWERDYALGYYPEPALRGYLAILFRGEAGRRFWSAVREVRPALVDRAGRRFCQIVEEEYEKAVASGPPTVPAGEPEATASSAIGQGRCARNSAVKGVAGLLLAAAGSTVIGRMLWRRAERPSM